MGRRREEKTTTASLTQRWSVPIGRKSLSSCPVIIKLLQIDDQFSYVVLASGQQLHIIQEESGTIVSSVHIASQYSSFYLQDVIPFQKNKLILLNSLGKLMRLNVDTVNSKKNNIIQWKNDDLTTDHNNCLTLDSIESTLALLVQTKDTYTIQLYENNKLTRTVAKLLSKPSNVMALVSRTKLLWVTTEGQVVLELPESSLNLFSIKEPPVKILLSNNSDGLIVIIGKYGQCAAILLGNVTPLTKHYEPIATYPSWSVFKWQAVASPTDAVQSACLFASGLPQQQHLWLLTNSGNNICLTVDFNTLAIEQSSDTIDYKSGRIEASFGNAAFYGFIKNNSRLVKASAAVGASKKRKSISTTLPAAETDAGMEVMIKNQLKAIGDVSKRHESLSRELKSLETQVEDFKQATNLVSLVESFSCGTIEKLVSFQCYTTLSQRGTFDSRMPWHVHCKAQAIESNILLRGWSFCVSVKQLSAIESFSIPCIESSVGCWKFDIPIEFTSNHPITVNAWLYYDPPMNATEGATAFPIKPIQCFYKVFDILDSLLCKGRLSSDNDLESTDFLKRGTQLSSIKEGDDNNNTLSLLHGNNSCELKIAVTLKDVMEKDKIPSAFLTSLFRNKKNATVENTVSGQAPTGSTVSLKATLSEMSRYDQRTWYILLHIKTSASQDLPLVRNAILVRLSNCSATASKFGNGTILPRQLLSNSSINLRWAKSELSDLEAEFSKLTPREEVEDLTTADGQQKYFLSLKHQETLEQRVYDFYTRVRNVADQHLVYQI